jgi:hypothetical protein
MAAAKNAMEIFMELDKSNCRLCGEKTCLAFASAVFLGKKKIAECPRLSAETLSRLSNGTGKEVMVEEDQQNYLGELTEKAVQLDFTETAQRIGAENIGDVLSFAVLGKKFGLSKDGRYLTDLHMIPWLTNPVLDYICHCRGEKVSGDWISFREIPGGREKYGLFKKRCEDVLKSLGDNYPDFFHDVVQMFDGRRVAQQFESDVSVVLYPLPLVPIMICFWKAEDGMESKLNLFFDRSVGKNLGNDSAFFIGTGLAQMFEKLAEHHGF